MDNGSVDETAAVVQEFIGTSSVQVTYLFEPKPGVGNASNAGLRTARGGILAFTDDDCYPAPDFLCQMWSAFDDPSVGYITGRILLHDPADFPTAIIESVTPHTFLGGSFFDTGVNGANMAFRREVLLEIGGFDPLFGPGAPCGSGADLDAAGRASAMGWMGQYRPEVIVSHHHGRKASDVAGLWRRYGIGRGAYHMKLLLRCHQFSWFARGVYGVVRQLRGHRRDILWEVVGAVTYAYAYLTNVIRNRPS